MPLEVVPDAVGRFSAVWKEKRSRIGTFGMGRNPGFDLAREIRRRRDRAIARLGLGAADPGLVLFAILEGFVDAELRSVKIFNPKDENLCRPETASSEDVQYQMLPGLGLREQGADLLQAQKAFADILLNRGYFELARR